MTFSSFPLRKMLIVFSTLLRKMFIFHIPRGKGHADEKSSDFLGPNKVLIIAIFVLISQMITQYIMW